MAAILAHFFLAVLTTWLSLEPSYFIFAQMPNELTSLYLCSTAYNGLGWSCLKRYTPGKLQPPLKAPLKSRSEALLVKLCWVLTALGSIYFLLNSVSLYLQINLKETDASAPPNPQPIALVGDEFDYSTANIKRRNFAIEFGLIIIFPLVLMVIILFILSYVMFGRREGV